MQAEGGAPDPHSPAFGDWRLATTVWVTAIDGVPLSPPRTANQVSTYQSGGSHHSFATPSASALHLNVSWRAARDAVQLRDLVRWKSAAIAPGVTSRTVEAAESSQLFDYFEALMVSAIAAYASIEAFCNGAIVDKVNGPMSVKTRRGRAELDAEELERELSTEDKLKRILPGLYGCSTPAGKAVWQQFVQLRDLRDAVTHFKRRDQARTATKSHEPTVLFQSYQVDPYTLPETAMAVISHFHMPSTLPRWMCNPGWCRQP